MECGNPENGYAKYKCLDYGEEHFVSFSCKSRFNSRCAKVYVDRWVDKQVDMILDVIHLHMVFTVPEELRGNIYWNRDIIKDLSDKVAELIQRDIDEKDKIYEYEAGIITVIHTFVRDMGFNPHVHALIAEEGYKFECPKCGEEDEVPGFVIDEFAMGKNLKEGEMTGVACPKCNAEIKYKYTFKREPY